MKKLLTMLKHNAGLKILAFLFACALWLYVLNVEDPEITRSFTVEVTFENTDTLSDAGKSYEVEDSSKTVRVTVSAQRSIIEELNASDFSAVVDLSELSESEMEGTQTMEVYISLNRYASRVSIISDTKYANISIEDELTKTIEVTAITQGNPEDGYAVGDVHVMPSSVTVTGVESQVERVHMAVVTVSVSGMSEDLTQSGSLVFYDDSGNNLDVSELSVSNTQVDVYIECDEVKTVSLTYSTSGTLASGYKVSGISATVEEIEVQGDASALKDLDEIEIDGDELSVAGASEEFTVTVSLSDYLPYGVSLYSDTEEAEVTVTVEEYDTLTLTVSTEDIVTENLDSSLSAAFSAEEISVALYVPTRLADSITESSITFSVDLSDKEAGTYMVSLNAELPDGVYLVSMVSTTVVITED